jgi:hypothetical protein
MQECSHRAAEALGLVRLAILHDTWPCHQAQGILPSSTDRAKLLTSLNSPGFVSL